MDIVCPVWVPGANTLFEALSGVAAQGIFDVEWMLGMPGYFDESDPGQMDALCETLERTGVRMSSLHTPFGEQVDIGSLDPAVRARGLDVQRAAIELARRIGSPRLVVHPGHGPGSDGIAERLALAVRSLRELEPLARDAGVVLALENLPPRYPGGTANQLLSVANALDSPFVGICFDSGHAHLAHDVPGMAWALLPRTVTMHLHDNDGSDDQHLLPGRGGINWVEFGRIYLETGCRAPAMLECAPPDGWTWPRCVAEARRLLGEAQCP